MFSIKEFVEKRGALIDIGEYLTAVPGGRDVYLGAGGKKCLRFDNLIDNRWCDTAFNNVSALRSGKFIQQAVISKTSAPMSWAYPLDHCMDVNAADMVAAYAMYHAVRSNPEVKAFYVYIGESTLPYLASCENANIINICMHIGTHLCHILKNLFGRKRVLRIKYKIRTSPTDCGVLVLLDNEITEFIKEFGSATEVNPWVFEATVRELARKVNHITGVNARYACTTEKPALLPGIMTRILDQATIAPDDGDRTVLAIASQFGYLVDRTRFPEGNVDKYPRIYMIDGHYPLADFVRTIPQAYGCIELLIQELGKHANGMMGDAVYHPVTIATALKIPT